MSATGEVLDTPSLLLPKPADAANAEDVTWDGAEYVVGWPALTSGINIVRVRRDGAIEQPLHLQTDAVGQGSPFGLASNGAVLAAAYYASGSGAFDVTLFRQDGSAIDTVQLSGTLSGKIVADGNEFAVALEHSIAFIPESGGAAREVSLGSDSILDIAADPSGIVALTKDASAQTLFVVRVARDGAPLSRVAVETTGWILFGAVAEANGEIVASWKSSSIAPAPFPNPNVELDLSAARVDAQGNVIEKKVVAANVDIAGRYPSSGGAPVVATNGQTALLAWIVPQSPVIAPAGPVRAMPVSSQFGTAVDVSIHARDQLVRAIAANGSNFLVLWTEGSDLRFGRVTPSGDALDGDGTVIATDPYFVATAADGATTVVVWTTFTGLWSARIGPDGQMAGPAVKVIADPDISGVALACSDGTCLAAWSITRIADRTVIGTISVGRLRGGVVLDPSGLLVATNENLTALAAGGGSFLLTTTRGGNPGGMILSAAKLAGTGGSLSMKKSDIAATTERYAGGSIAWDGSRFVVLWEEIQEFPPILRASRISSEGDSLDGDATAWRGLDLGEVSGPPVGAVAIGGTLAVAFVDRLASFDLGTLAKEQEVAIDNSGSIFLAASPDGFAAIAYTRNVEDALDFQARRGEYRLITGAPPRVRAVRH